MTNCNIFSHYFYTLFASNKAIKQHESVARIWWEAVGKKKKIKNHHCRNSSMLLLYQCY